MRLRLDSYAPVHKAKIDRSLIARHIIQGFAAPLRGPSPCRVELVSEERVVSVANACGFSEAAQARGVRLGWCGFHIGGLSAAGALGGKIYLRCAVSGNLLEELSSETSSAASMEKPGLSVPNLRKFIGDLSGCSKLDQISPFGEWYRNKHGDRAFIEASYAYFLNRKPTNIEISEFLMRLPEGWGIVDCWQAVISSREYSERRNLSLPGIFSTGFPFGLELLD